VWCDVRNAPALEPWSDLLGCHVGVRADVLRGIPAWQAKRLLHGAPQTTSNCNAAEFVGRPRASPEGADEGVALRSTVTTPRFILDTKAAYLSGIGRFRLPTAFLTASRGAVGTFHTQNLRYGFFSIKRNRYSPTSRA
jgi:hypothetical protein